MKRTIPLLITSVGGIILILSFFIPFANVVMPYQIMQETWRASDPNLVKDPRSWQQSSRF